MAENTGIEVDDNGEFIVYTSPDGTTEVQLRTVDGTAWMSQRELAELYAITVATVSRHLSQIFESGELTRAATVTYREIVGVEQGRQVKRRVEHYNLDLILAVGYKVRGPRGAQFRQWASTVLAEYLIKGFAMNDARLKDPRGTDYFAELLERIRDIRTSEARLYQQIRDIFAESHDYNTDDPRTGLFFAEIQNKLHFAITGNTAPEIIAMRADPAAPNMGLTSWKSKNIRKADVTVAKNYLNEDEIDRLNLLTSQFLDYAEGMARRRKVVNMADWVKKTDDFIEFNEYPVLTGCGRVSREAANGMAGERFGVYKRQLNASTRDDVMASEVDSLKRIEQKILADRARLKR
ncbi:helix-turn-helix DNA binding domain protein [Gordonia phage Sidious]|uniref:Helix-turn-helix DNA binding domain protein n=1 Tax=Gordonia phage Sidious TaxID=2591118 RepID=A0A515MI96_9CAUD|nr:helix-turn-helix DNA binding domain protein [Gordonia phage Sidious]QDM56379.1 helix-turn-helix DNA binding domain protein [Gordonia phage Sidious]